MWCICGETSMTNKSIKSSTKPKLLVEYSSNNSGGSWWLKDNDWKKLEKSGWNVEWAKDEKPRKDCEHCGGTGKILKDELIITSTVKKGEKCYSCLYSGKDGRYLGALAKKASKYFYTIKEGLEEFERITSQSVTDEGCSCCGPPHNFTWSSSGCIDDKCDCRKQKGPHKDYNFGSGESLSEYLYQMENAPKNLREAMEMLSKQPKVQK